MGRWWSSALVLGALVVPWPVEVGPAVGSVRVTGTLGGPDPSSVLVEGFDLERVPDAEGDTLSVSIAFGSFECVHDATVAADVEVSRGLSRATASGTTAGTCTDRGEVHAPMTSTVDLRWEGTGPVRRTRTTATEEGRVCTTIFRERRGVLSGTVSWTAPDLDAAGTGTPSGEATFRSERTVCRPA